MTGSSVSTPMFAPPPPPAPADPDAAIRATDGDAAQARLSAVRKAYLQDPFIHHFVQRAHLVPTRAPLINIGTYVRSEAIDALVSGWLSLDLPGGPKQIVSLGAGSDTRFWRIDAGPLKNRLGKYVEIDFLEVAARKLVTIRKNKALQDPLGPDVKVEKGGTSLSSDVYHLLSADLRLPIEECLDPLLEILSPDRPTLFISECVFCYMSEVTSSGILGWFSNRFDVVGGIVYEMFRLQDSFGKIMRANLQARNVQLPGVEKFVDIPSLEERFKEKGYQTGQALTLKDVRQGYISASESLRISRLEFLDEVEEMDLVLDHYAVSWGAKSSIGGLAGSLDGWRVPNRA